MRRWIVVVALLAVVVSTSNAYAKDYTIRELAKPTGYTDAEVLSMNDSGVVVGGVYDASGVEHSAVWKTDGTVQIDPLSLPAGWRSRAVGINNHGQVLLDAIDPQFGEYGYLLNSDGTYQNVGTLGGTSTWVYGLNDSGQVVGGSTTDTGLFHAFLWKNGVGMTDLGISVGNDSKAMAISNNGNVVGRTDLGTSQPRVFFWNTGGTTYMGTDAVPNSVNNQGMVAGMGNPESMDIQAVVWDASHTTNVLGYGNALGINDLGQVVGWLNGNAVMWDTNGEVVNLSGISGFTADSAVDTNNVGQILGYAVNPQTNELRPVVWQAVPEPSGILALLFGACGLGGLALRRR